MLHNIFTANATVASSGNSDTVAFAIGDDDNGDFGSGTLKLQGQVRGQVGGWFDITNASWTAATSGILDVSKRWNIRAVLSGSTSPDLAVSLEHTTT